MKWAKVRNLWLWKKSKADAVPWSLRDDQDRPKWTSTTISTFTHALSIFVKMLSDICEDVFSYLLLELDLELCSRQSTSKLVPVGGLGRWILHWGCLSQSWGWLSLGPLEQDPITPRHFHPSNQQPVFICSDLLYYKNNAFLLCTGPDLSSAT